MTDFLENESKCAEEIKALKRVIEDMRRAGIKLRNELSDFVEEAKSDNANSCAFPKAQEALAEWNELIKQADLAWKEEILKAPCKSSLKFLD